jgi:hypothetical protein
LCDLDTSDCIIGVLGVFYGAFGTYVPSRIIRKTLKNGAFYAALDLFC